jgi:hypothetical protein
MVNGKTFGFKPFDNKGSNLVIVFHQQNSHCLAFLNICTFDAKTYGTGRTTHTVALRTNLLTSAFGHLILAQTP